MINDNEDCNPFKVEDLMTWYINNIQSYISQITTKMFIHLYKFVSYGKVPQSSEGEEFTLLAAFWWGIEYQKEKVWIFSWVDK